MTLELCNWVVHMGNWYKVHKGGLHTALHLFSRWLRSVPVGVQYTIIKRASRLLGNHVRAIPRSMRDARAVQLGSSYG